MTETGKKALGFWALLALVIGNMIGSGIYLLPATLAPLDPEVGLEAGVIAALGGRDEAARKSFTSVIHAAPGSDLARRAQQYLDQLGPAAAPSR